VEFENLDSLSRLSPASNSGRQTQTKKNNNSGGLVMMISIIKDWITDIRKLTILLTKYSVVSFFEITKNQHTK
jgi:hypothetical protein